MEKTQLGNITKIYGRPHNSTVSNLTGNDILSASNLKPNTLIISSPTDINCLDIGTHSILATDGDGKAVRLTYTIQPGNGLIVGRDGIVAKNNDDSDIISMAIDDWSIKVNENSALYVETENIIDNNTIKEILKSETYNGQEIIRQRIKVITENLDHATQTTYGIAKGDELTIETNNGELHVNTQNLDYVDNTNNINGIIRVNNDQQRTITANDGILSVITTNLDKATTDNIGVVKGDNTYTFVNSNGELTVKNYTYADTRKIPRSHGYPTIYKYTYGLVREDSITTTASKGVMSVITEGLDKASTTNYGVVCCDGISTEINDDGKLAVTRYGDIIAVIDGYDQKITDLYNLINKLEDRITVLETTASSQFINLIQTGETLIVLNKPIKGKMVGDDGYYNNISIPSNKSIELQVVTNCAFNVYVEFDDNVSKPLFVSEVKYNNINGKEQANDYWTFESTGGNQGTLKITFTCDNYSSDTNEEYKLTTARIKVSSASNSSVYSEKTYSFKRWNNLWGRHKAPITVDPIVSIEEQKLYDITSYTFTTSQCNIINDVYVNTTDTFDIKLQFSYTYNTTINVAELNIIDKINSDIAPVTKHLDYISNPVNAVDSTDDSKDNSSDSRFDVTTIKNYIDSINNTIDTDETPNPPISYIQPTFDNSAALGYIVVDIDYDCEYRINLDNFEVTNAFDTENKSIITDINTGFVTACGAIGVVKVDGNKIPNLTAKDLVIKNNDVYYKQYDDNGKIVDTKLFDSTYVKSLQLRDNDTNKVYDIGIDLLAESTPQQNYVQGNTNNKHRSEPIDNDKIDTTLTSDTTTSTKTIVYTIPKLEEVENNLPAELEVKTNIGKINKNILDINKNISYDGFVNKNGIIIKEGDNILNNTKEFSELFVNKNGNTKLTKEWLKCSIENSTSNTPILKLTSLTPIGQNKRYAYITITAPNIKLENGESAVKPIKLKYTELPTQRKPEINIVSQVYNGELTLSAVVNNDAILLDNKDKKWNVTVGLAYTYTNNTIDEKNINYINLSGNTNELNLNKEIKTLNNINGLKIVNAYTTSFENIPTLTYYSRGKITTTTVKSNYTFGNASITNISIDPWNNSTLTLNIRILPGNKTNLPNGMEIREIYKNTFGTRLFKFMLNSNIVDYKQYYDDVVFSSTKWDNITGCTITYKFIKIYDKNTLTLNNSRTTNCGGVGVELLKFNYIKLWFAIEGEFIENSNTLTTDEFCVSKTGESDKLGNKVTCTANSGFSANVMITNANYHQISTSTENKTVVSNTEFINSIKDYTDAVNKLTAVTEYNIIKDSVSGSVQNNVNVNKIVQDAADNLTQTLTNKGDNSTNSGNKSTSNGNKSTNNTKSSGGSSSSSGGGGGWYNSSGQYSGNTGTTSGTTGFRW